MTQREQELRADCKRLAAELHEAEARLLTLRGWCPAVVSASGETWWRRGAKEHGFGAVTQRRAMELVGVELRHLDTSPDGTGLHLYYGARARASRFVYVCYINYQGENRLTREEAEGYLAWLDAGNVGKHFQWRRERADALDNA